MPVQLEWPTDRRLSEAPADRGKLYYDELAEKAKYFDQIVVTEPDHLINVLSELPEANNFLYRGVRESSYKLFNSLQRRLLTMPTLPPVTFRELWSRLVRHVREVRDGLLLRYFRAQGIENITDLGALAFLQHHAGPTPLLDWTYDLHKALWFMVGEEAATPASGSSHISEYASLYLIELDVVELLGVKKDVERVLGEVPERAWNAAGTFKDIQKTLHDEIETRWGVDMAKGFEEELRRRERSSYFRSRLHKILDVNVLTSRPVTFVTDKDDMPDLALRLYNNLNLVNQDGAFVLNATPFVPLESVLPTVLIHDKPETPAIYCYDIHKRLFPLIRKQLDVVGCERRTVFVDPYEVCTEVGEAALERV